MPSLPYTTEPDSQSFSLYVDHFRSHLADTEAHLRGDDGTPLGPSYYAPAGYWTNEEKNRFFHALSRYSRYRPDLIAACISTKTVYDVCSYIRLLEAATSDHPPIIGRPSFDPATDVSKEWIIMEETLATTLSRQEPEWEQAAIARTHEAELERQHDLLFEDADELGEEEESQRQAQYDAFKTEKDRLWARDALKSSLAKELRQILNGIIIRAQYESSDAFSEQGEKVHVCNDDDAEEGSAPDEASVTIPAHFAEPDVEMADATSRQTPPPVAGPSTFPSSPPPPTDFSHLSPASKKRIQKRLCARRRRAQKAGVEYNSDIGLLTPGRKPKERKPKRPYPKHFYRKDRKDRKQLMAEEEYPDLPPDDLRRQVDRGADGLYWEGKRLRRVNGKFKIPNDPDFPFDMTHRSGRNKHQKWSDLVAELGIDIKYIESEGLDLFNLPRLDHLMKQTAEASGIGSTIATSISWDTLRFLQIIIRDHISKIIHQAISYREHEMKMKKASQGTKKLWKVGEELTRGHVELAMKMIGIVEGEDEGDEDSDSDEEVTMVEEEPQDPLAPLLTIFPLIESSSVLLLPLPQSGISSGDWRDPKAASDKAGLEEGKDLMDKVSGKMKDKALDKELKEEMELEDQDVAVGHANEDELWRTFRPNYPRMKKSASGEEEEEEEGEDV